MREQFLRAPYNHLIKKLNICNIPLSESEECEIRNHGPSLYVHSCVQEHTED